MDSFLIIPCIFLGVMMLIAVIAWLQTRPHSECHPPVPHRNTLAFEKSRITLRETTAAIDELSDMIKTCISLVKAKEITMKPKSSPALMSKYYNMKPGRKEWADHPDEPVHTECKT